MKLFILILGLNFSAFAHDHQVPVVDYVDLNQYVGRWYEIERFENSFQKSCEATRATYTLDKGRVEVLNECRLKDSSQIKSAKATARVVDKQTNARLKVNFVPILRYFTSWPGGDYNIIALDESYQYAMVGDNSRKYLWILSRTPTLDELIIEELKSIADDLGYDSSKLRPTPIWK